MKTKNKITVKLLAFFLLSISMTLSCNKKETIYENAKTKKSLVSITKERDPKLPLIISKRGKRKNFLANRNRITFKDYLGRSYKINSIDYGTSSNLGFPVINTSKLYSKHPNYFFNTSVRTADIYRFSYSDFSRYSYKSKKSETVKNGLSLNLGIFTIDYTKNIKRIFTDSLVNNQNRVFGELNAVFKGNRYSFQTSSNIINKILFDDYLTNEFKDELYNTTPSELFESYGGFVLTDFFTGGKVKVLYSGLYSGNDTKRVRERNMDFDISASYKWSKGKKGASINFGVGNDYYSSSSISNKITNLYSSIRTVGGDMFLSSFTVPKKITDFTVDFSTWSKSLSDEKKHALIEISRNGLIPLSDLILEENLKLSLKSIYKYGNTYKRSLVEPYIKINLYLTYNFLDVILNTRFGDTIVLRYSDVSNTPGITRLNVLSSQNPYSEEFKREGKKFLKAVIDKYSSIYNMKIKASIDVDEGVICHECDIFFSDDFNENKMSKYLHNGMTYLLYNENGKKYGYSIYNDYILDTYGIRKFVNKLQVININPRELRKYKIVAL